MNTKIMLLLALSISGSTITVNAMNKQQRRAAKHQRRIAEEQRRAAAAQVAANNQLAQYEVHCASKGKYDKN